MARITLVYPGIAQIGFASYGGGTPSSNLMSLGLGYLSASIRQRSDHQVDLIDLRKLSGWDHFERELRERDGRIVGIHTSTVNFDYALTCARIARGLGKTVIAGGPHATLDPQALIDSGHVDHVVTGEGELTIVEMLDRMDRGRPVARIVAGRPVADLDTLPFPDRELFDLRERAGLPGIFPFPPRYVGILASRGCGFDCAFCQPLERKLFGRRIKFRSVENIVAEVRLLKERYDAEFLMFQDDQLTQNRHWLLDLCAALKPIGIAWGALARVDRVDEQVVRAMRDAGCIALHFGFESGSQRILDFLRKGTTVAQALQAARICREQGLLIFANYMLGIPTETEADLQATYRMIKTISPEIHGISYFSPIPGSDLYEYCRDNDLIAVSSYDMYVRSAVDDKIRGVDYRRLGRFRKRIERCRPAWFREPHYAACLRRRWRSLRERGYALAALKERIWHTPLLDALIGAPYRLLSGRRR